MRYNFIRYTLAKFTRAELVCAIVLALSLGVPTEMPYAQANPLAVSRQYILPPDDLAKALVEIALQSQVPIVVPYDLVQGYRSSPVIGTMKLSDALEKLLKHTPFTFHVERQSGHITLALRQPSPALPEKTPPNPPPKERLEEVVVTGIRGALTQSMDVKRFAIGFVDAISAEDIGHFPDTNLAESIQRIPGATISRNNGEGSKVTVRGFTGNYNLVTLNGRVVPVISTSVDRIEDSRAFDFAHMASENVRQVLIHKTHQADLPEGGIGALIDIQTYRPLETGQQHNYFSLKGLHDPSNRSGRRMTPEVATLLTLTDSEHWGVSLAATLQERDSGSVRAYVNRWDTARWSENDNAIGIHSLDCEELGGDPRVDNCSTLVNPPAEKQLYSLPTDLHFALFDSTRKRVNTHLIAQLRPTERWTLSLDYALFTNHIRHVVSESLLQMTDSRSYLAFDQQEVKSPTDTIETIFDAQGRPSAKALGFAAQQHEQYNRTEMVGFNTEYVVRDNWLFTLDAHSSESRSGPADAPWGSWRNVRFGANVVESQKIDWRGDLPQVRLTYNDQLLAPHNTSDGVFDASDIGTQAAFTHFSRQKIEVDELNLTGQRMTAKNDFTFGLDLNRITNHTQFSDDLYIMGDWGIQDPSSVPDDFFSPIHMASEYSGFDTDRFALQSFSADADALIQWAEAEYPNEFGNGFHYSDDFSEDRAIEERSQAIYAQYHRTEDLFGWTAELAGGLRFIHTEVQSSAIVNVPSEIVWLDNGDFDAVYAGNKKLEHQTYGYQNWLPNLHLLLKPSDQWVYRLAYSQSLARAEYREMNPEVANIQVTGITLDGQRNAFAEVGNPKLEPIKSVNVDLSIEWYFDRSSYLSIGYYAKQIDNFIGIENIEGAVYQLRDATIGARAQQARRDIESTSDYDGVTTDTDLFNQIAATENGDFTGFGSDNNYYGDTYDIHPAPEDPPYRFSIQTPNNNKQVRIWGLEYAAQIFLGKSGFGIQANYTSVNGDVGYDKHAAPDSRQFALLGLSDSMNLVLLYENDRFQARLAHNWRSRYLDSLNVEPTFVEGYRQLDFMASYQLNQSLTMSIEGINLTGENSRSHGRTAAQLNTLTHLEPRFLLGLKYRF